MGNMLDTARFGCSSIAVRESCWRAPDRFFLVPQIVLVAIA
jgi:hypothetical protein